MTAQNEHLMELTNEIVRLKLENENLKRQLEDSVPVSVVRDLKKQLWKALEERDSLLSRVKRFAIASKSLKNNSQTVSQ